MIDVLGLVASNFLLILVVLVVSAFPLYLGVKLVGGEGGFIKVLLVNLILTLASIAVFRFIAAFAGLAMLVGTFIVYMIAFKISFFKAILAWVLQYAFVIALIFFVLVLL